MEEREPDTTPDPDLTTEETNPTPDERTLMEEAEDDFEPKILDEVLPEGHPADGPAPLP